MPACYVGYVRARKREVFAWPVGMLSVAAAGLVGLAEAGLTFRLEENPSISLGWGAIVAGIGAVGLLAAGLWQLVKQPDDA